MISEKKDSMFVKNFRSLVERNITKQDPKQRVAVAFSGGVDSTVMLKLLKNFGGNLICYVVGTKGCADFNSADQAAKEVSVKLKKIEVSEKEISDAIEILSKILRAFYKKHREKFLLPLPLSVSYNLPLFFVAKHAEEKYIFAGQGPDELLGGYSRHSKMQKNAAIKEIEKDTNNLQLIALQNKAVVDYFGKELKLPYLSKELSDFCLNLPFELKLNKDNRGNIINKYILRLLAKNLGLSDEIAFRKKKAAQYGSGLWKIVKRIYKIKKQGKVNK